MGHELYKYSATIAGGFTQRAQRSSGAKFVGHRSIQMNADEGKSDGHELMNKQPHMLINV